MASTQFSMMGRLTESRATRGLLSPSALIRSASARIKAAVFLIAVLAAAAARPPRSVRAAPRSPRRRRSAPGSACAARPATSSVGSRLVGRIGVPAHDVDEQLSESLYPLGGEHLGG